MADATGRLAEFAGALALASDLGHGAPREHSLRVAVVAVRLGRAAGIDGHELQDAYYAALLRWAGCTATGPVLAAWFGDDLGAHRRAQQFDGPLDPLIAMLGAGAGRGLIPRLRTLASALAAGPGAVFGSQCEAAVDLAARLGCTPAAARNLGHVFERWDGRGWPGALRGDGLPLASRLAAIADDADMAHSAGGEEAAVALIRRRAARIHDPHLAEVFAATVCDLWEGFASGAWAAAMDAEPGPARSVSGDDLDRAFTVFADFADLKCPWFAGHSRGVAGLAAGAAETLGLGDADRSLVVRAAMLHDLGRVAVSNVTWDRPGALTADDREAVRLHPYHTQRATDQARPLRAAGALAALHHERLDGGGYPGARAATTLTMPARLLCAADVVHALREPRPHRAALTAADAARVLRDEVRSGRLDADAVDALLGRRHTRGAGRPAGLTAREVAVLRLLVRGGSNREIATRLGVSHRTVGHHIAHIYEKTGVTTRAGATLFPMRQGLVEPAEG